MDRSFEIRKQLDPDVSKLAYPFSEIEDGYEMEYRSIPGKILGDRLDEIIFPRDVKEYFWIHEGENDVEDWRC